MRASELIAAISMHVEIFGDTEVVMVKEDHDEKLPMISISENISLQFCDDFKRIELVMQPASPPPAINFYGGKAC